MGFFKKKTTRTATLTSKSGKVRKVITKSKSNKWRVTTLGRITKRRGGGTSQVYRTRHYKKKPSYVKLSSFKAKGHTSHKVGKIKHKY